ncbi:MAG: RNA 2',3'-cyclic phosphodiesterase [Phycisphaerae bacterium]
MRLFVAIEPGNAITTRLIRLQQQIGQYDGLRWLSAPQMHLTLKFLGDVGDSDLPAVCDAVRSAAAETLPLSCELSGVGIFPTAGAARILWAGVRDPDGALAACHERCELAFDALGFPRERRAFSPHVTIGRVRKPALTATLRAAVARVPGFRGGRMDVDELVLFDSLLQRSGPDYAAVCRCPLGAGGEPEDA